MAVVVNKLKIREKSVNLLKESSGNCPKYKKNMWILRHIKKDAGGKEGQDHCVLVHSNRVCVITVAPSHPILAEKKEVTSVDFQVDKSVNRLENKVIGKGKRGAQNLSKTAALCHVTCSDGTKYTLYACLKSNLVEVNERLVQNPELLTTKPETDGYIAIVLTHLKDHDEHIGKLKSPDEYEHCIQARCKHDKH